MIDLLGLADVRDVHRRHPPDRDACGWSSSAARCATTRRCCCSTSPPAGWTPTRPASCSRCSRDVASTGVAILLVEHDVELVFHLADRVYAMAEGRLIAAGTPDEVRHDPQVREAYLDVEPVGGP